MENKDPSRTERPTPKRIYRAREDGNVMKSNEVVAVAVVLVGTLTFILLTMPYMSKLFREVFYRIGEINCVRDWTDGEIIKGTSLAIQTTLALLAPVLLLVCFTAAIALRAQIGPYFHTKPLQWKFEQAFKVNLESILPTRDNLINFLLTLAKMSVISLFVYISIANDLPKLSQLPLENFDAAVYWVVIKVLILVIKVILALIVLAIIDYVYRKKKYEVDLRMTKDEVRDERKNVEGDPRIKAAIRRKMMRFIVNLLREVPKADVVITNPTHVAVALKYDPNEPAPRVVAKGLRKRALRIKELARAAGVPLVENKPLARSLYRKANVGGFVPAQFFSAVAAILARLHRQGLRTFKVKT